MQAGLPTFHFPDPDSRPENARFMGADDYLHGTFRAGASRWKSSITIFKMRAPGMSLNRMPLFCLGKADHRAFMVIFAMPAVMLSSTMLLMDRTVNTHFFNPAEGGDAICTSISSGFLATRRFTSFLFRGRDCLHHHLHVFATTHLRIHRHPALDGRHGIRWLWALGASHVCHRAAADGRKLLHRCQPHGGDRQRNAGVLLAGDDVDRQSGAETPMLFALAFFFVFIMGGLTGVFLASVPVDLQVHDTFFVVAHFHYVLIGGAVFPLFGALYYWMPKITGRMLNEAAGKWHFWLFFIGFNMTFFPMHILGLRGMPRRVYTYPSAMPWANLNMLASLGALFMTAAVLIFIANFFWHQKKGELAGDNPWGAATLEWATTSPPPVYNFAELPTVNGRDALWDALPQTSPLWKAWTKIAGKF